MTEDEAKTKICPKMSYCVNELGAIQDGDVPFYAHPTCIASACMAWRWEANFKAIHDDAGGLLRYDRLTPVDGYCGLAGRQE